MGTELKGTGEMVSRNLMEIIVADRLKEIRDSLECCKCDRCMLDITTYVLNRLPPKYAATMQGNIFSHVDALSAQYRVSILMLILEASRVVRENPSHAESDTEPKESSTR